jgi:hypothetical protein
VRDREVTQYLLMGADRWHHVVLNHTLKLEAAKQQPEQQEGCEK